MQTALTPLMGPCAVLMPALCAPAPPPPQASPAGNRSTGQRPVAYCCYLCGAQFGSQSLGIHLGACREKWERVEGAKPAHERRPLPPPPEEMEAGGPLPSAPAEVDAFNARMFEYYDRISLTPCAHCGRTFRPDALEKHAKVSDAGRQICLIGWHKTCSLPPT